MVRRLVFESGEAGERMGGRIPSLNLYAGSSRSGFIGQRTARSSFSSARLVRNSGRSLGNREAKGKDESTRFSPRAADFAKAQL
jgi:hypothetical protein